MPETEAGFPDIVANEEELDELLSRPSRAVVEMMKRLEGDIMLLGISGKIGPGLALCALRAIREAGVRKRVIGVSRFTQEGSRAFFESRGIEIIGCDLMNPSEVAELPHADNVVFLAGRKFGTSGEEALTWAANVLVPANVARRFASSRIVAFSTGAVYPMVAPESGGCTEDHRPGPIGEYAQSCLGRERIFEHFSRAHGTRTALIRLNYAVDLRYGVLYDIGKRVLEGKPIPLAMGYFNAIWQGDVNNQTLAALEHCASGPIPWNVTRPEIISTRETAEKFAARLEREALFEGKEGPVALLSNPSRALKALGPPGVDLDTLIRWQAHWLIAGGRSLGKPTHFEETGGEY